MDIADVDVSGVNNRGIETLVLDICKYSDKIKTILNSVEDIIDSTKNYYLGPDADELRKKFSFEKDSIENLNKNIFSYSDELLLVKTNFKNVDVRAAETIFEEKVNFTRKADKFGGR